MTQTEALARLRIILDEASPGGFWSDTELYQLLDSGQNTLIQYLLTAEKKMKKLEPYFRHSMLEPLVTLDTLNTTSVGGSESEYSIPSDYLATYRAEYNNIGSGSLYEATHFSYEEIKRREANTFTSSIYLDGNLISKNPYYYIRAGNIGFFPQPSGGGANMYRHHYYKQPLTVASGQTFTLRSEAHEMIIEYAVSRALEKDSKYQEAQMHYRQYINQLSIL